MNQGRDEKLVVEKQGQVRIGTAHYNSNKRFQSLNNSEEMDYNSGGGKI